MDIVVVALLEEVVQLVVCPEVLVDSDDVELELDADELLEAVELVELLELAEPDELDDELALELDPELELELLDDWFVFFCPWSPTK